MALNGQTFGRRPEHGLNENGYVGQAGQLIEEQLHLYVAAVFRTERGYFYSNT